MRIEYISDVHDETRRIGYLRRTDDQLIDVLVLAGDISSSARIDNHLRKTQEEWKLPIVFVRFNEPSGLQGLKISD